MEVIRPTRFFGSNLHDVPGPDPPSPPPPLPTPTPTPMPPPLPPAAVNLSPPAVLSKFISTATFSIGVIWRDVSAMLIDTAQSCFR